MIFDLENEKDQKHIQRLSIAGGKIRNQLLLSKYSLPIPESLVIFNETHSDEEKIKRFIYNENLEYQLRSENIGSKLRYSESSGALKNSDVLTELTRIKRKDKLILLQRLPKNCRSRDSHSVQYTILDQKLIIEIRAGIATHLARCGWPLSEYYEIPLKDLAKLNVKSISEYQTLEDKVVLKESLFLDSMDEGLHFLTKKLKNDKFLDIPWNEKLSRYKKIYEIEEAELEQPLNKMTIDIDKVKKLLNWRKNLHVIFKFLKIYKLAENIENLKLSEFLALVGFITSYLSKDNLNSLRRRWVDFLGRNILYRRVPVKYLFSIVTDAKRIRRLLEKSTAKLSIINAKGGKIIFYWDLISWKK